ncbi:GntR family transcriptional regulator [Leucobacter ruminantium]|uniref:GntR family transcriptional regulator n=1 Tax=Leucobacter ruminantium TaxID=1289170 RepID=A0A939LUK5_9MICO|nr:GntR family transcriptional regulator [Leucobacter ruminantium]MBO1805094.1 GntR family transcriptional regulator [Leucobacter ruminantium]
MSSVASRRIRDQLIRAILDGELLPGQRIRQEALAAEYGVSRVPVREALHMLEREGLVTLVQNTGAWVTALTQRECTEIYEIRERIEPLLLSHSMHALDPSVCDRLEELNDQMLSAADDPDTFMRLDWEFHWLTYSAAEPSFLLSTVRRLWNVTQAYRREFVKHQDAGARALTNSEHLLIIEALRRGDDLDAGDAIAAHIRRTRKALAHRPEIFEVVEP